MRPNKTEYGLRLAEVASQRSEDPRLQVGCVALTSDGRVIATAYNGLAPGMEKPSTWWQGDEPDGLPIHAEQNLCALFTRGQAETVCLTHEPCGHCLRTLIAHGVRKVYFRERAVDSKTNSSARIAAFYGIAYQQWPASPRDTIPASHPAAQKKIAEKSYSQASGI